MSLGKKNKKISLNVLEDTSREYWYFTLGDSLG